LPFEIYFSWDIYRDPPSTKTNSNVKAGIWHPAVGLRCRNPPRHLCQLKTWTIPQGALEIFPVPDVDSLCWICIYNNICVIDR
jgi:hypothetical protein